MIGVEREPTIHVGLITNAQSARITLHGRFSVNDSFTFPEGDYTVTPTLHTASGGPGPPPFTNFGNWEGVSIFFTPSGEIAPGQSLVIEMSIFEVFLDANVWGPGEVAAIEQYPTLSPAAPVPSVGVGGQLLLAVLLAGFGGCGLRRGRL